MMARTLVATAGLALIAWGLVWPALGRFRAGVAGMMRVHHTGHWWHGYATNARVVRGPVVYVHWGPWWRRRRPEYVGQARDFERRMTQHQMDGPPKTRWWRTWVTYGATVEELDHLEQALQDALRPRWKKRDQIARHRRAARRKETW